MTRRSDPNPAYWEQYRPFQQVKHELIRCYLNGWYPKLGTWAGRVLYVDTHAGRGRYESGDPGSPVLALQTLLRHSYREKLLNTSEFNFLFIERDPANLAALEAELSQLKPFPPQVNVETSEGDAFERLSGILGELRRDRAQMAPAFLFVDPYGFKIPAGLLGDLMKAGRVELFINVMWRELDMLIQQRPAPGTPHAQTLDETFGSGTWRTEVIGDGMDERLDRAIPLMARGIGARWWTSAVRIVTGGQATRYVLLHLTNSDDGRDLMKECAWSVSPSGGFMVRRSDNPDQQFLIKPEPDFRPLRDPILGRLSRRAERWQEVVSRKRALSLPSNGSTLPTMVGAVIYVRVSTKEQTENFSLPTQLRACEEYCRRQGYEILERFHEEGESAKSTDRSQLQNLLTFCRLNKGRVHFVVVFNLTRFARDKYDHFALRSHLQSLGISLRSATEPIDDTSTGKLMEGVLAAFAQFDNDVRSDRTRAGMKAALELGRWVFLAPIGYLNAPRSMGKSLIHDPERAALVRRAFEEYATGRFTKEQLLKQVRSWGLTNRRGKPVTSQAIGVLLRNRLYAGIVDVPEYGVRAKRGDFEPLISEELFYRAQAILSGRVPSTAPRKRAHPDFPLRGFVRCESCGRGLTGSWSKGHTEYYAYYHCRPGCRAVNVTKATLEGLFADELALLQPTPGYMRLLKESVLQIWKARKAAVREEIATAERAAKAIQDKLDRLDEAFLFERSIEIDTYDRHAEKLREELTLARIDRHSG